MNLTTVKRMVIGAVTLWLLLGVGWLLQFVPAWVLLALFVTGCGAALGVGISEARDTRRAEEGLLKELERPDPWRPTK